MGKSQFESDERPLIGQGNQEFDLAPPWKKKIAFRKNDILRACEEFNRGNPNLANRAKAFCQLFNLQKISSISREDYRRTKKLAPRTLYNWIALKRKGGIDALLPRTGRPGRRAILKEDLNKIRAIRRLHPRAEGTHIYRELQALGIKASLASVYRAMRDDERKNRQFYDYLDNPDHHRGSLAPAFGDADGNVTYSNQLWEADASRTVNILSDGKIYFFYVVKDIFSRRVRVLITDRPRASALAALIKMALHDWGKPAAIRVDFGKDFRAKEIVVGFERLGIKIAPMLPYSPERKPFIERFIGRYKRQFLQYEPGFIGQDAQEAAAIRAREREFKGKTYEGKLSLQELQERTNKWIREEYEQTPHRGLGGIYPAVKAAQSPAPAQYIPDRALNFLLCPGGTRKMTREGIFYRGGKFFSLEIADLIGQEVEIREDLKSAGILYIFAGSPKEFRGIAKDASLVDYSPGQYDQLKKQQKAANQEQARAWGVLAGDYLREKENRPRKKKAIVTPLPRRVKFESHEVRAAIRAADARERTVQQSGEAELQTDQGRSYGAICEIEEYDAIVRDLREGKPILPERLAWKREFEDTELFKDAYPRKKEGAAAAAPK